MWCNQMISISSGGPPPINLKSDLYPFQSIFEGTASRLRFLTLFDHGLVPPVPPLNFEQKGPCSRERSTFMAFFLSPSKLILVIDYRYMIMFHCRCAFEKYGQLEKLHDQIGISEVKTWIVIYPSIIFTLFREDDYICAHLNMFFF